MFKINNVVMDVSTVKNKSFVLPLLIFPYIPLILKYTFNLESRMISKRILMLGISWRKKNFLRGRRGWLSFFFIGRTLRALHLPLSMRSLKMKTTSFVSFLILFGSIWAPASYCYNVFLRLLRNTRKLIINRYYYL